MEKLPLHKLLAEILLFAHRHQLPDLIGLLVYESPDSSIQMTAPDRSAAIMWINALTSGQKPDPPIEVPDGSGVQYLSPENCPDIEWGRTLGMNWPKPQHERTVLDDATLTGLTEV